MTPARLHTRSDSPIPLLRDHIAVRASPSPAALFMQACDGPVSPVPRLVLIATDRSARRIDLSLPGPASGMQMP